MLVAKRLNIPVSSLGDEAALYKLSKPHLEYVTGKTYDFVIVYHRNSIVERATLIYPADEHGFPINRISLLALKDTLSDREALAAIGYQLATE